MNRVRWLVGPIMYWIPVRSKRYHTKPCQSNYVLDTGKKLSCPTRGRHATLHLLQKTISEDVQTKLFFQGLPAKGSLSLEWLVWSQFGRRGDVQMVCPLSVFAGQLDVRVVFVCLPKKTSSFVIYCHPPQIRYSMT